MDTMIGKLLDDKPAHLVTMAPEATVLDAVTLMNALRIGSVLVLDGTRARGIFTERDVLTRVVAPLRDPAQTMLVEVMTRELVTVTPTTSARTAMELMTERRLRHLPVMHDGAIVGMLSIGDLTRWMVRDQKLTIDDLTDYIVRAG